MLKYVEIVRFPSVYTQLSTSMCLGMQHVPCYAMCVLMLLWGCKGVSRVILINVFLSAYAYTLHGVICIFFCFATV